MNFCMLHYTILPQFHKSVKPHRKCSLIATISLNAVLQFLFNSRKRRHVLKDFSKFTFPLRIRKISMRSLSRDNRKWKDN